MHETGMVRDLVRRIETIARENHDGRVAGARVWLGALSHMSPAHFREHFAEAARGTSIADIALTIEHSEDTTHARAQDVILESVDIET